ncbi:hypothetical protein WBG78_11155 [Chryseolinea sp. T2]|uniref:hypothetical protein n=1 Tax=Chryseolinea sp. T2 TaxID=3129255 RepID=UPI0030779DCA
MGASAQKQLVLLKGQKVILRLYPGDEIELKMRGSEDRIYSYVNNLFDTALMAHETLIPFSKIDRIYFEHTSFMNKIGTALIIGGVGYFLIDQLNTVIVQGEDFTIDENVATTSAIMVGVGLPMKLIRKKSQRMKPGYHLLTVESDSPFYKHEVSHMAF